MSSGQQNGSTGSAGQQPPGQRLSVLQRLYTGTGAFNIVGRSKQWYALLSLLVLACIAGMIIRGFNFGIEFVGGTQIQMPAQGANGQITTSQVEETYTEALNQDPASVQSVGSGASQAILLQSERLEPQQVQTLKAALFDQEQPVGADGQPSRAAISDTAVSASWGGEITQQAGIALAVFLVLVAVFLALYFERAMAIAALVALVHDVMVTAGVYAWVGFQVSPATVIGLLTILGFSLYDTVVVFDKVRENTRGILNLNRRTYGEAANLAVNQTLMRSINTTVVAVLPVLGLLAIGAGLLGVGTLKDLALVQLTGMLAGVFSSIVLATPVAVDLKQREKAFRAHTQKVLARRRKLAGQGAAAPMGATGEDADAERDGHQEPAVVGAGPEPVAGHSERAEAAAASVPGRSGKGPESRRTGSRRDRSAGPAKPTGKRSGR